MREGGILDACHFPPHAFGVGTKKHVENLPQSVGIDQIALIALVLPHRWVGFTLPALFPVGFIADRFAAGFTVGLPFHPLRCNTVRTVIDYKHQTIRNEAKQTKGNQTVTTSCGPTLQAVRFCCISAQFNYFITPGRESTYKRCGLSK